MRILYFKTTRSEFQKASHTATEQGKAKQHILDFKTTWSEFQKPSQTATEQVEAELHILGQSFRNLTEVSSQQHSITYVVLEPNIALLFLAQ